MRTQYNPNRQILSTALASAVKRGTGAAWYAPLVKGDMDINEWLRWVDTQSAERQDGSRYPAIYSLMGGGSFAANHVTRSLWAASKAGVLPYTKAVHQAEAFRGLVESITHGFAGQLRRAVPEVTAATVSIKTRQQEGSAGRDMEAEIEEAIEHYRVLLLDGEITSHEFDVQVTELLEIEQEAKWAKEMGDNAVTDSDSGRPAEDEGSVQTALHKASDMWNYEAKDILGAETAMVEAIHAFKGVDLPIDDPDWSWVTDRLADSWALSLEYAKDDVERSTMETKIAYRAEVAEKGITSMPWKARWATNHIARRIWRDRIALQRRIDNWEAKVGEIGERMAAEEKYNLPARMTRVLSEAPSLENEDGSPRSHYLIWDVVEEAEIAPEVESIFEDAEYLEQENGKTTREVKSRRRVQLNQGEYQLLVTQGLIERANKIKEVMDRLYALVRGVDLALAPVWREMHDPEGAVVMPEQPPIYWNQKGFYLTEEAAMEAIAAEDAERKQATLDGVAGLIQQMLAAQGWNK